MCGIVGYIGQKEFDEGSIRNASRSIRHRGPDGEGVYKSDNAVLIHRRLAILDLESRSDQPFKVQDKVLIFNGEIYNYLEVRKELESLGHHFKTSGDTEVLAHALLEWGVDGLDRLEGMWAFAWYDESDGSLLLSRDRFGEKPLYYWETDEGLYFASEIKAIAALAGRWPGINKNHLIRYMVNGYRSLYKTNELFYENLQEVKQASFLKVCAQGSVNSGKYWNPDLRETSMSFDEATEQTRHLLKKSVELRMRSDVPLAFCMSGGIDSNSLIALASREFNYDVQGFTIINKDQRYDEQDIIEDVVEKLGLKHTAIPISNDDFISNLTKLVSAHDAPVSTITFYVHWQLMKAVHDFGYKVAVMGTAADELFSGYYDHHNFYLANINGDTELYEKSVEAWKNYQAKIVRNPYLQQYDIFIKNPELRDHLYLNNDEFASWLRFDWQEDFTEIDFGLPVLKNRMLNEVHEETVPVLLNQDDLNSMFYSIENRSPFLDRALFEFAYSIPTQYLVQNGVAKAVLRESMRGLVPDSVLDSRKKVGFNAPILELLDVKDQKTREYLLDNSPIYEIVDKQKIEDLISNEELKNSMSKFLFYFLNAKIFLEQNHVN